MRIGNPGIWNPKYNSGVNRNLGNDWNLESKFPDKACGIQWNL